MFTCRKFICGSEMGLLIALKRAFVGPKKGPCWPYKGPLLALKRAIGGLKKTLFHVPQYSSVALLEIV